MKIKFKAKNNGADKTLERLKKDRENLQKLTKKLPPPTRIPKLNPARSLLHWERFFKSCKKAKTHN